MFPCLCTLVHDYASNRLCKYFVTVKYVESASAINFLFC